MSRPTQVFEAASASLAAGLFIDASRQLAPSMDLDKPEHCILMAEARWRLGQSGQAVNLIARCTDLAMTSPLQAKLHELRGLVFREEGRAREAISELREASRIASDAGDLRRLSSSQILLFSVLLDSQGPASCESMAAEVRQNTIKSGDAFLFGCLHARFAEFEAKRGNLSRASRHLEAGFRIIERRPNAWLLGVLWIVRSATEAVKGSISQALRSARRARDAAKVSGHERVRLSAIGNIALLSLWADDRDQADAAFREIVGSTPKSSNLWFGVQESYALRHLVAGDLDACESQLRAGETELRSQQVPVHALQSLELEKARARLEAAKGDVVSALARLTRSFGHVCKWGDPYFRAEWTLEVATLNAASGNAQASMAGLDEFVALTSASDIGRRADAHWLRGVLARSSGSSIEAKREFGRAQRIWKELGGKHPCRVIPAEYCDVDVDVDGEERAADLVGLATLLNIGQWPKLLGAETARLIGSSKNALRVRVVAGPAGSRRIVFDSIRPNTEAPRSPSHSVELGEQGGHRYELQIYASDEPGARAVVASVLSIVEASVGLARLEREDRHRTSLWPVEEGLMLEGNVFVAPRMREILSMARRVAPSDLPVLITGETGSGKEIIAREVHDASPRAAKSFGVLVCSAVPREMLDSHLFGHRRGAFTGAIDNFLGVIRANEGGTLFLDEIGEVSLDLQVKLLRFLETGEVHPLGETRPVKVDVRVIAATNQPLEALIKESRFREDLFYRLNVVRVTIPPLRERREEILPFFERFLMRECARIGRPVPNLSDQAVEHLLLYNWPGNVRQLLNEVKRVLVTLPVDAEITPNVLSSDIAAERQAAIAKAVASSPNQMLVRTDQPLAAAIEEVERAMLKGALANSPDLETAAEKLDITRKGLFLKRQRLGLE